MKYDDQELLEVLAGQYVLGTLRGRARTRFERLCEQNPKVVNELRRWEDHMMGLSARIPPITPPNSVWRNIERRLGLDAPKQKSLFGWSWSAWSALLASAVLAIAIGVITMQPSTVTIAVIAQTDQINLWNVRAEKNARALLIEATSQVKLDAAHAYELWALPDSGSAPVSLGLLPTRGNATLALNSIQQAALRGASKIAVSLEPVGGSPTGTPTGPVIHVVEISRVFG